MTDVTLGRKRKKAGLESAVLQSEDALDLIESEAIEAPKTFTYAYDDELGTVDFELTDGTPVTLRSPRTSQLLTVSSWMSTSEPEMRSNEMVIMRIAAVCAVRMGELARVSMAELLNKLDETNDLDDIKRLAIAVNCFRSELKRFFGDRDVRGAGAGVSDS
jgi:hypothetical protein